MTIKDGRFGRSILAMIAVGFVALIGVAAATFWLNERSRIFNDLVVLTRQVEAQTRSLLSVAQDAETGLRGYLLTREDRFLEPYENAVARVPGEFANLRRLTRHNPAATEQVDIMSDKIAQLLAIIREALDQARESSVADSAAILAQLERGRRTMDELRDAASKIVAEQNELFASRSAAGNAASQNLLAANFAALALVAALALACFFVARNYLNRLVVAQGDLEAVNADLNKIVEERTGEVMRANDEIQRFAYIVSHDLRAPLVNIMGFTSELDEAAKTLARQQAVIAETHPDLVVAEADEAANIDLTEAIGFIRASTTKMDRLINAILQLSRDGRSSLAPERVDMQAMAQQIADSIKHQTEEAEAEILVEEAPSIVTDRLSIEQVFGNLIENAIKYVDPARPGRVVIRGRENGSYAEFEIEDNGRGIEAKDHERVFELFRRAGKQDKAGEGLGLAFVRSSVRKLGGSIRLDSELGRGTVMHLKFPKVLIPRQGGRA